MAALIFLWQLNRKMSKPTIIKRKVDANDFRKKYGSVMTGTGLVSSLVQRVCNLLVDDLNTSGYMDFSSAAFKALVSSASTRDKLQAALEAAVELDYDYYPASAKAANTNVSIELAKANPTLPLRVINDVADAVMTTLSMSREMRSRVVNPTAAAEAAGEAAAAAAGATTSEAKEAAKKAVGLALLGITAAAAASSIAVVITGKSSDASPSGSRNVITFRGNGVVLITIPYNKQISEFTEEVSFSDGSKKSVTVSTSLTPSAEPSGFVGANKADVPAYLAAAVLVAKKNNEVAAISALVSALDAFASKSSAAKEEVAQVLQEVAAATGTSSNSSDNFTLIPIGRGKYQVAVLNKSAPLEFSGIKAGERYEFPEDVTVKYAGVSISLGTNANGDMILLFDNKEVPSGTLIPGTKVRARIGSLILESTGNTFPAMVNPYRAIGDVLVYKRDSVELLAAGESLPPANRVSWAPDGVPAGSLLRDLGRSIVVANADGAHVYHFRNVQLINGAVTEGVGGSTADVDEWRTGWICTWADSGEPFSSL